MKSGYVYLISQVIKSNSRRAEKELILARELQDPDFRELVRLVYSPMINFYITDTRVKDLLFGLEEGNKEFGSEILELLIKLSERKITGKEADLTVRDFGKGLDSNSRELLLNIFKRSLDMGVNVSTFEKIAPGLIQRQPYMRCITEKEADLYALDWAAGVYAQVKMDGMYAACRAGTDGSKVFTTRAGSVFPKGVLENFDTHLSVAQAIDLNGEFTLVTPSGNPIKRKTSNGVLNSALNGTPIPDKYILRYTVWDVVPSKYVDIGFCEMPYSKRWECAQQLSEEWSMIAVPATWQVFSREEAIAAKDAAINSGEEGIILKEPFSPWINGINRKMIKMKGAYIATLRVVGFTEGKRGKFSGMVGSLKCISEDGLLLVNVSGFSDAVRLDMSINRDGWFHKLVDVQHGGVIEDDKTGIHSLIEPRLAVDSIRTDIIVGDTLDKIAGGG